MRAKLVITFLCVLTLTATVGVLAFHYRNQTSPNPISGAKIFEVRGEVRSVDASNQVVRIAHEEIPNYMQAMTMPFAVKDASLLMGLSAGDRVQFQLAVTEENSWIAHLERVSDAAPSEPAAPQSTTSAEDRESERAQVGETVPDFALVDQDGGTIHLQDFRGKAVVLTFIYTRCPLPNYCPLMSRNFAELQKRLSKEFAGRYRLLSISMDSEFDTPAVLKEYASNYDASSADWTFATGDAGQIEAVARLTGLYYVLENGLISHDLRTVLIGPDGRLLHVWKSNVWTPYEVQRMVRETLSGMRDVAARSTRP